MCEWPDVVSNETDQMVLRHKKGGLVKALTIGVSVQSRLWASGRQARDVKVWRKRGTRLRRSCVCRRIELKRRHVKAHSARWSLVARDVASNSDVSM